MIIYLVIGILGIGCLLGYKIFRDGGRFSKIVAQALYLAGWVALVVSVLGMLSKNTGYLNIM